MTAGRTEKLRETLRELHAELEAQGSVDPELRALLRQTVAEIQLTLDEASPGARPETGPESFTDRLAESARHFEASHPALASAVGRVIDALAALGI